MITVDLFPYQDAAVDQALDRGNLLIAYGMGLGKTLIQMAISEELIGEGEVTMNCLVVPASLKWQWAQALVWGTDVRARNIRLKGQNIQVPIRSHAVVVDGSPQKRDEIYAYAREHRPNYVILGYENVVNDWRQVKRLKPELIALDEATAIKSFKAERSRVVKQWWAPYRYALTGTPIDNRPEELFSLMEWIDPEELGRFDLFDRAYIVRDGYGRPKRYKNLDVLHRKTKQFVARKTRFDTDVKPFMPKDFERQFYVDLTGHAKSLYSEVSAELVEALEEIGGISGFDMEAYYTGTETAGGTEQQGNAMAKFSALAMLCDHPLLLVDSARKFEESVKKDDGPILGSKYAFELLMDDRLEWITDKIKVPKFEAVIEEVHDILDENEESKVIIFSFSKMMLRLLKTRIEEFGTKAVIFDGDMSIAEKESAKMQFKRQKNTRVFLSSDAGGMGVDLPEANYLINYNHPWSAGKADQRNSRHIRAGSKWEEVWVLDYIVRGSVEEWKYDVLGLKRRVGSAIMDGGKTNQGVITNDVASLLEYLR